MRPNIEAIFERYEDATREWMEYPTVLSAQDVPALLAYIDELENIPLVQTVVKLQGEKEKDYQMNSDMALTLIEKSDEIERLRKELKLIQSVTDYESTIYEITCRALRDDFK